MRIVLLVFLLISFPVVAGPGTGEFTIEQIKSESGNVYIYPNESIPNPMGCELAVPIKLDPADVGFDQMFSLAITGLTTKKKIKAHLRPCVDSPWAKTVPRAHAITLVAD